MTSNTKIPNHVCAVAAVVGPATSASNHVLPTAANDNLPGVANDNVPIGAEALARASPLDESLGLASYHRSATGATASIERQKRAAYAFMKSHNGRWAGRPMLLFGDVQASGMSSIYRPGLSRLLASAERGEFDTVFVEDVDRFSRNHGDLLLLLRRLNRLGVRVVSSEGPCELSPWYLLFHGTLRNAIE